VRISSTSAARAKERPSSTADDAATKARLHPAAADAEHTTHQPDGVFRLVGDDEGVLRLHVLVAHRAKKADALRIASGSSFSRSSSRRS